MKNKNNPVIVLISALVFVCLLIYLRGREQNDLKKNGVIVSAKIINVINPSKGGMYFSFNCEFEFKGKRKSEFSGSKIQKNPDVYLGKTFPALYAESTNTLRLLMASDDYKEFGLDYPDSLLRK